VVARPNGLTITTDGKTLIVDDTIGPTVFAYDVQDDGTVRNKRPFVQLHDIPAGMDAPGGDAATGSTNHRLEITGSAFHHVK
jgi:sugar lactone lactonase YvrE